MGRRTATAQAISFGRCEVVRIVSGHLYAGDVSLGVCLPTWEANAAEAWHEVVLLPAPVIT
jgi:hypothetical protein